MGELSDVLPRLTPPPGGELRLRQALRAPPSPVRTRRFALAAMCLLVLWAGWLARPDPRREIVERELASVLAPTPSLQVAGARVQALPSARDDVRLYAVIATP